MEYGAHLPLIDFGGGEFSLARLQKFASTASSLGYHYLCANDHMVFSRPWLDGLTALSATLEYSGDMTLMTTVALPAIRGPVPLAKAAAAMDVLSGGRMIVGVGPGSSAKDYQATGLDFGERWKRLDESVRALRALWTGGEFRGRFYAIEGIDLQPRPAQPNGPPIWIGSWGSQAGTRRVARLADGWLASCYNTTPADFAEAKVTLHTAMRHEGKQETSFPNAIATAWMYISDDVAKAEQALQELLVPMINRPAEDLRQRVLIGSREECAAQLRAFADSGAQRIFVWPIADELQQLELFADLATSVG
jgi:alkanesulfonate monooxygenase SsuD/methylene tetrahydromethanopterin reductase-like flavin-dependent oxidoreductase (luciferase family)